MSGSPTTPRSREPFVWAMFSGGGMLAALFLPAVAGFLWVAVPLGWLDAPSHGNLMAAAGNVLVRVGVFGFVVLCFFHWAHRFRYTLYDGLQLYHLNELIALVTYGIAIALSGAAAWIVWTLG